MTSLILPSYCFSQQAAGKCPPLITFITTRSNMGILTPLIGNGPVIGVITAKTRISRRWLIQKSSKNVLILTGSEGLLCRFCAWKKIGPALARVCDVRFKSGTWPTVIIHEKRYEKQVIWHDVLMGNCVNIKYSPHILMLLMSGSTAEPDLQLIFAFGGSKPPPYGLAHTPLKQGVEICFPSWITRPICGGLARTYCIPASVLWRQPTLPACSEIVRELATAAICRSFTSSP